MNVLDFILKAHGNQMRRGDKELYVQHCIRVSDYCKRSSFASLCSEELHLVALMHDVVEDTEYSFEDCFVFLKTQEAKDALVLLTKQEGESGSSYMQRLLKSGNKTALVVKYYDALDNADFTEADKIWTKSFLEEDPEKEIKKYLDRAQMCLDAIMN